MILHIVTDDKFIDMAYRIFEEVSPNNNVFLLVGKNQEFTYIKKTPIQTVSFRTFLSKRFIQSLVKFEMVIFHSMTDNNLQLISKMPDNIKSVWIGWGADYYDLITEGDESKLLQPLTKSLFDSNITKRSSIRYILNSYSIRQILNIFIQRMRMKKIDKSVIVNRIDFFAPVLYEDYELIKTALPGFKPEYIVWNYGTLEDDTIKGIENGKVSGNNILIGNSATYNNNHLDAFEIVSAIDSDDRLIISPLSYGDPVYRDNIINYGKQHWEKRFIPVIEFMPIEEYTNFISSCSIVIMNHLRQQAVGNIDITMYLGAKIFLNKENPVYQFYKTEGAFIFSIDELEQEINTRLNDSQIEHNQNILRKNGSREAMFIKTRKLIAIVSKNGSAPNYN